MRLATKIFAGAALVVVAALGAALLVTRGRADHCALLRVALLGANDFTTVVDTAAAHSTRAR